MQIHRITIPDTARKIATSATELLGHNNALSTPAFEANIVYTSSPLQGEESAQRTVELVQQSVGAGVETQLREEKIGGLEWARISGILREGAAGIVAQTVYICELNRELYSVTFSCDVSKTAGMAQFAEDHMAKIKIV